MKGALNSKFDNPKTVDNFYRKIKAYCGDDSIKVYEVTGLFLNTTSKEERKNLLDMMKAGFDIWELYPKKKEIPKPEEIEDNQVYSCRNKYCSSKKTYPDFVQKRSADEGMSCFIKCSVCKSMYQVS